MSKFFPIINIPNSLKDFYNNWFVNIDKYIEPQEPERPCCPVLPKNNYDKSNTFGFIFLIIFVIILYFIKSFYFFIIELLLWILIVGICYIIDLLIFKKTLKSYNIEFEKYQIALNKYNQDFIQYTNEIEKIREYKKNSNWLSQKRIETNILLIKPIKKAYISFNTKKGSSERFFYDILNKYFGNLITADKTTEIFHYYQDDDSDYFDEYEYNHISIERNNFKRNKSFNAYVPDFIFSHDRYNMTIDIEIDEPYTSNKPIHTFENTNDNKRNEYFTSLNWFVIRFSERQIMKHPDSCCKEIALLIFDYTGDISFLQKFEQIDNLPLDNIWTYEKAKELISINFRTNYNILQHVKLDNNYICDKFLDNIYIYNQ